MRARSIILITYCHFDNQHDSLIMPTTEANNYPFSDAVKVGNLLFMSGLVGNEESIGEDSLVAETHSIFKQMKAVFNAY